MNSAQRQNAFWNGFDLPAYDETSVPNNAVPPYITYETADDGFEGEVALTASLWYRSLKWKDITLKEMQIADTIGRGGIMLRTDRGALWIKKGNPFAQRMADAADDSIRRIVLNVSVEFIE